MDEKEVVRLYVGEKWTLRRIADHFASNHHRIRRILQRHEIPISAKNRRAPMSEERRRSIGEARKGFPAWSKGLKMTEAFCRANMKGRLRTEIDLSRYPDYERLLFLSRLSSKHKQYHGASDEARRAFFDKFYFDDAFNAVFDAWLVHDKSKWWYPSLDHIDPKANGGTFDLENLQFLTWFENRAKADMLPVEWATFKRETDTRSALFIEDILENNNNRRT